MIRGKSKLKPDFYANHFYFKEAGMGRLTNDGTAYETLNLQSRKYKFQFNVIFDITKKT